MRMQMVYVPSEGNPLEEKEAEFEGLSKKWKRKESNIVGAMQRVTGLEFKDPIPTKMYEKP